MSKYWKEKVDPKKHLDFMSSSDIGGTPLSISKTFNDGWVYLVRECSFTFQFMNLNQLDQMIEYFSAKIHSSTRVSGIGLERYWQKWHERIPKGLIKDSKRLKILKALKEAKEYFK